LMATFQGSAAAALTASSIWTEDGAAALNRGDGSEVEAQAAIGSVSGFDGADDLGARASILSLPDGFDLLTDDTALDHLLASCPMLGVANAINASTQDSGTWAGEAFAEPMAGASRRALRSIYDEMRTMAQDA